MIKTFGILVATSSLAFALTNNCPNGTGSATLSGNAIPGTSGNSLTDLNALDPGDANFSSGCGWIDKVFTGFTITGSFEDAPGTPLADGIYTFVTPSSSALDPLTNVIGLTFATVRGAASSGTEENANDGDNNFHDSTGDPTTFHLTYIASIAADSPNLIYGVQIRVNDVVLSSQDPALADFNLCVGLTATSIANNFTSLQCTTAGGTFVNGPTTNLLNGDNLFSIGFAGTTRVAINNFFSLDGSGDPDEQFATFQNEWIQTPEPSSFILLGGGLAVMGVIARRRRKKA